MSPTPTLKIRQPRREEIPLLVNMQVAMAAETEPFRLDAEIVTLGVTAVFDDASKGAYWVAEDNGVILGMLLTVPEWSDWRNGTVLWIHSVYVSPDARGRGIYKAIYTYLKNKVESDPQLRGLRLYVEQSNKRAQKVYETLGMSSEHYYLYEWMKGF